MTDNEHPSAATTATATADEAVSRKHVAMLERLSNRHNSRLSTKPDPNSSSESSTQSFLSQFSQSKISIESHLSTIRQNPNSNPNQKPQLESISAEISALEKLIAESSYFLPSYEVRTCLAAVASLKQSLDDVTSIVIPKKKFSFKNKPSKKPAPIPVQNDVEPEKTGYENHAYKDLKDAPGFRNRENELLVKEFNRIESEDHIGEFTLSNLSNCEIRLKGCVRALFINRLVNCKVYVGAITGSVLIEGAEGCVFALASHQIRVHNAKRCDFYLRSRSRPIIEDCSGVRFAPYCLSYEGLDNDLAEANLCEETGNWMNVDDFRWLRAVQSPNWSVLPENERIQIVDI